MTQPGAVRDALVDGVEVRSADLANGLNPAYCALGCALILGMVWIVVGFLAPSAFLTQPAAQVWRGFAGVQIALWTALYLINRVHERWSRAMLTKTFWIFIAVGAVNCASYVKPRGVYPKLELLGAPLQGFILLFTFAATLILSAIAAATSEACEQAVRANKLVQYIESNSTIRRAAASLGVALVAAIFSTSWLQRSLEQLKSGTYPKEMVVAYGLYFSALFVAILAPTILKHQNAANRFLDSRFPISASDRDTREQRSALASELGVTSGDGVQAVLTMLSPLIGSVITTATS